MNSSSSFILVLLAIVIQFLGETAAHSMLVSPPPRFSSFHSSPPGPTIPACGYRNKGDKDPNPDTHVYRRGQKVPMSWPRNNHPGGFIQVSIAPFKLDQRFSDFEDKIVQISCHESGCKSGYNDPFSGDNMPVNSNLCRTELTVPDHYPDGKYTLQWLWYGGNNHFGDKKLGQNDYYSCHDFTISGGTLNQNSTPPCPVFIPGDAHNPASKGVCKYFGSGLPHVCVQPGCQGELHDGKPKLPEQCEAKSGRGNSFSNQNTSESRPTFTTKTSSSVAQRTIDARTSSALPKTTSTTRTSSSGGAQPTPETNGGNLQTFSSSNGTATAPAVHEVDGRFHVVDQSGGTLDTFDNAESALRRSCRIQHEQCSIILGGAAPLCVDQEKQCWDNFSK